MHHLRASLLPFASLLLAACAIGANGSMGNHDAGPDTPDAVEERAPEDTGGGCRRAEDCDDSNVCTENLCDVSAGVCGFRRIRDCCLDRAECDDGDACTVDSCEAGDHRCVHTRTANCCNADTDCNDRDACTQDRCDTGTHRCATPTAIADCCQNGAVRSCYTGASGTQGVGRCRAGMQTCASNRWTGQPCAGEVLPASMEVCDGTVDDDCNGRTDENCTCTTGATRTCYSGPAGTSGNGGCHGGMQSCTAGRWSACTGEQLPGTEICGNAIDEDCSGADAPCPPANDTRANATVLTVGVMETTVTGTTVHATHDGPNVDCSCTSGGNVWYRFTLTVGAAIHVDTASTLDSTDTSLLLTDDTGAPLAAQPENGQTSDGLCNDDSGCGATTGWGTEFHSRTWAFLGPGTYFIAVGSCGEGPFTLHLQNIPTTEGSYFYTTRISGESTDETVLIGTNQHSSTCGGRISGEDVRWFVTCGANQFFSMCQGDGGGYVSRTTTRETTRWDPVLYTHSGITGHETVCSSTGFTGVDCRGQVGTSLTGATQDTVSGGARLTNRAATRGVNAILVDEVSRGSGMWYRIKWRITDVP